MNTRGLAVPVFGPTRHATDASDALATREYSMLVPRLECPRRASAWRENGKMVEVKGKFITLAAGFIKIYPEFYEKADKLVFETTGLHQDKLDPEGWYDIRLYTYLMECYTEASITKEKALVTLGKGIYPTIRRTVGFPPGLKTPTDFIEFEAQAYLDNVRGPGIRPRKIIKMSDRYVIVRLRMDEQPCKVGEGVYQGMLEMTGHPDGTVEHKKCIKNGDAECEFHVKW